MHSKQMKWQAASKKSSEPKCPAWILSGVRRIHSEATTRPAMPDKSQQATEPKELHE